ncbi:ABC transporter substrate-binding protein [Streptomyces pinistramenti]|uniref:ABC transporter substrate-binding protein n=1 Tax=Streptomyces pinistramenti TaxID=2884812 RepID=UPI001D089B7C|nr:ABC transporter substrate-binding protein [Streptomyces pinistramenti]MCB5909762.1 ABC transporter substrate-binding protein [Streptomyces pinistramenti]
MTDHVSTGRAACRRRRCAALIAAGVLLPLPVLAGCGADDDGGASAAVAQDIAAAPRGRVRDGGTVRWAVDALPGTLNAFHADADAATSRVTGAVLPTLFTVDRSGAPQRNADYLTAADITKREPRQVVVYKLNPKARWSDGRAIGAADFVAQWKALRGMDNAYWTARNTGYDRIDKVEQGAHAHEVKVTFAKPYADWRSLFSPLYPQSVMGSADAFNDGARERLKVTAGPFAVEGRDTDEGTVTLVRNPKWWGSRAKLDRVVFQALPRAQRAKALAAGDIDVAEVDTADARKVDSSGGTVPGSLPKSVHAGNSGPQAHKAAAGKKALSGYALRKALGPAYTQLALNGSTGPLSDERVRRAVARAIDRQKLADTVLKPLRLPSRPLGSHLLLAGQHGYEDHSDAIGGQDTGAAKALLADAGWRPGKGGGQASPQPANENAAGTASSSASASASAHPSASSSAKAGPAASPKTAHDADGRNPERAPAAGRAAHPDDEHAVDSRPAAAAAPLSSARAIGAEVQQAALLRQSATYYRAAAADREDEAGGDTGGDASAESRTYTKRATNALAAAELIDTGQNADNGESGESGDDGGYVGTGRTTDTGQAADEGPTVDDDRSADEGRSGDDDRSGDDGAAAGNPGPQAGGQDEKNEKNEKNEKKGKAGKQEDAERRSAGRAAAAQVPAMKKGGKALTLRFVLPDGPGSEQLRTVGDRIAAMLGRIGVRTAVQKVEGAGYFQDHIAAGDYDLALYTWPGTAYPATDARPIYAKPQPAPDGSLTVEQNYTRVGTDRIDQLFDQAVSELDPDSSQDAMEKADARIWAVAGSIPLYQRPELVATKKSLANVGAFGFAMPRFQDIGYTK